MNNVTHLLAGAKPVDYYIHPDYALISTDIGGQPFEVALRHGKGDDRVTAISFRAMRRRKQ